MKFVIMNTGIIPGFGVKGPVLKPRKYDVHQVLKWLAVGVDVREVMEDGSYRKLHFNDEKLMELAGKDLENKRKAKEAIEEEAKKVEEKLPKVNKKNKKLVQFLPLEDEKPKIKEEKKPELPIDNLEKPE